MAKQRVTSSDIFDLEKATLARIAESQRAADARQKIQDDFRRHICLLDKLLMCDGPLETYFSRIDDGYSRLDAPCLTRVEKWEAFVEEMPDELATVRDDMVKRISSSLSEVASSLVANGRVTAWQAGDLDHYFQLTFGNTGVDANVNRIIFGYATGILDQMVEDNGIDPGFLRKLLDSPYGRQSLLWLKKMIEHVWEGRIPQKTTEQTTCESVEVAPSLSNEECPTPLTTRGIVTKPTLPCPADVDEIIRRSPSMASASDIAKSLGYPRQQESKSLGNRLGLYRASHPDCFECISDHGNKRATEAAYLYRIEDVVEEVRKWIERLKKRGTNKN